MRIVFHLCSFLICHVTQDFGMIIIVECSTEGTYVRDQWTVWLSRPPRLHSLHMVTVNMDSKSLVSLKWCCLQSDHVIYDVVSEVRWLHMGKSKWSSLPNSLILGAINVQFELSSQIRLGWELPQTKFDKLPPVCSLGWAKIPWTHDIYFKGACYPFLQRLLRQ